MTLRLAGIVLAGGLARRMGGGDKGLVKIGGTEMLSRVIDRLRPQVGSIALNANGDPSRFSRTGLPVIADPVDGHAGPLAGVLAGMIWASALDDGTTHVVTVASDTPFFPGDLATRFVQENGTAEKRIVLARSDGNRHPVFGMWPVALLDDLQRFMRSTDTYKVLAFVGRHDHRFAEFPMIEAAGRKIDPFFNANTPDDIDEAEQIALEIAS